MEEHRVEIRSYDWLIEAAAGRISWFRTFLYEQERKDAGVPT